MKKQIFKRGDKVFHYAYKWGKVIKTREEAYKGGTIVVVAFEDKEAGMVNFQGRGILLLSFTEYTLQGFSQERPIDWNDYVGKWGKFCEDKEKTKFIIGKLKKYDDNDEYCFYPKFCDYGYNYFEPLTEEQIKILGLE